jgi:2-keto-3-deoxy-L-rhamnonate aldolase RhmA
MLAGERLVGTFLKTPSVDLIEILSRTGLDFICLDAEHAPFGHLQIDQCVAALRAARRPSLVRVPDHSETSVRNALDCGATGILVPHVHSAEQAQHIARAAHFGRGGRGYAGSTRAAGLGTKRMGDHLKDSAEQTTVIVQIEDPEALGNVAQIAAVDNVDALFVGRIDLAVSLGLDASSPELLEIVAKICADAGDTCVGMFTPSLDELPRWREAGASLFLLGSDHALFLDAANSLARKVRAAT